MMLSARKFFAIFFLSVIAALLTSCSDSSSSDSSPDSITVTFRNDCAYSAMSTLYYITVTPLYAEDNTPFDLEIGDSKEVVYSDGEFGFSYTYTYHYGSEGNHMGDKTVDGATVDSKSSSRATSTYSVRITEPLVLFETEVDEDSEDSMSIIFTAQWY